MKSLLENNKLSIIIIIISLLAITILAIYSNTRSLSDKKSNYELIKEKDIYSGAVSLDSIFNKLDISLAPEEIPEFIDSSSCPTCMHNDLVGDMLNEQISDEFKLIYILNRATWKAFEVDENTMTDNYGFIVSVERNTIKKLAKQVFDSITIPQKLQDDYYYYGINDIVCMEESCYYTYTPFGLTGHVVDGYEVKTTFDGTTATVNAIYIEYGQTKNENIELETLTTSVKLKDYHEGKTINEYEEYTFKYETSETSTNIYDEFSKYYTAIPTYEYKFENNILKSIIKK